MAPNPEQPRILERTNSTEVKQKILDVREAYRKSLKFEEGRERYSHLTEQNQKIEREEQSSAEKYLSTDLKPFYGPKEQEAHKKYIKESLQNPQDEEKRVQIYRDPLSRKGFIGYHSRIGKEYKPEETEKLTPEEQKLKRKEYIKSRLSLSFYELRDSYITARIETFHENTLTKIKKGQGTDTPPPTEEKKTEEKGTLTKNMIIFVRSYEMDLINQNEKNQQQTYEKFTQIFIDQGYTAEDVNSNPAFRELYAQIVSDVVLAKLSSQDFEATYDVMHEMAEESHGDPNKITDELWEEKTAEARKQNAKKDEDLGQLLAEATLTPTLAPTSTPGNTTKLSDSSIQNSGYNFTLVDAKEGLFTAKHNNIKGEFEPTVRVLKNPKGQVTGYLIQYPGSDEIHDGKVAKQIEPGKLLYGLNIAALEYYQLRQQRKEVSKGINIMLKDYRTAKIAEKLFPYINEQTLEERELKMYAHLMSIMLHQDTVGPTVRSEIIKTELNERTAPYFRKILINKPEENFNFTKLLAEVKKLQGGQKQ